MVVGDLAMLTSLVEVGDLIVVEEVMAREVATRKAVGETSISRLRRSLLRALLLLLLVVALHPGVSTDHQGVHQPRMNVPIVTRKDTTRTLAHSWRLSVKLSVVGSQSALFVWL